MKKILFLASTFSDATGGTKYNKVFINHLKKNKEFSVDVLEDKDFGQPNGMRWFKAIHEYKDLYKTVKNYDVMLFDSSKYKQLNFHIDKIRRKNKNVKFICIHHHYDFCTKTGLSKIICKFLELRFLKRMDTIIYASEFTYGLRKKYLNSKIHHVLVKVPIKEYNSKKKDWSGNVISTIGGAMYGNRKGHLELMESLNLVKDSVKDFKLKIIGTYKPEDPSFKEVANLIDKYGFKDNVIYTDRIPEEEKYKILEESKFYVFPSKYEGYGLSVVEAMSAGLPVIVFNNSAMPTIVQDGYNGFLCNSIKEFAEKIKLLYNDTELCEKMGRNALDYVKTCQTTDKFYQDIDNFIKDELKEKK